MFNILTHEELFKLFENILRKGITDSFFFHLYSKELSLMILNTRVTLG